MGVADPHKIAMGVAHPHKITVHGSLSPVSAAMLYLNGGIGKRQTRLIVLLVFTLPLLFNFMLIAHCKKGKKTDRQTDRQTEIITLDHSCKK